jgi:hypothetical protein
LGSVAELVRRKSGQARPAIAGDLEHGEGGAFETSAKPADISSDD